MTNVVDHTSTEARDRENSAVEMIEEHLLLFRDRELVSASEVTDLLLDLRAFLARGSD